MQWRECAFRTCRRSPDRMLKWAAEAAGESELCEQHYQFAHDKFAHLLSTDQRPQPEKRFSEERDRSQKPAPGEVYEEMDLPLDPDV